uniref:Transposase Tc1-like domain-containing protein n=1 Tax=Oreochromis niloticus TaxID=8128 RepID=A0A669CE47_ORENI
MRLVHLYTEKRDFPKKFIQEIISLHKNGEGYQKISKALHISHNTVAKVVQKFKKDGSETILQRCPGCPRKLTSRRECLLMRRVEGNRYASSLQLAKAVESQTRVTVSHDTIRRTLQRIGMHEYCPHRKPLLKPMHKKACLEFAKSNEKKSTVFGTNSFKTAWRRKGEDFKEKCMVPTVKHGGGSVLMWNSSTFIWMEQEFPPSLKQR